MFYILVTTKSTTTTTTTQTFNELGPLIGLAAVPPISLAASAQIANNTPQQQPPQDNEDEKDPNNVAHAGKLKPNADDNNPPTFPADLQQPKRIRRS